MVISPLHVATIADSPIRFFRSPRSGPDLPWTSFDDLNRALGWPRAVRRKLQREARKDHPDDIATIATAEGVTTIVAHPFAQGDIAAAIDCNLINQRWEAEFYVAATAAAKALTASMPATEGVNYMVDAFRAANKMTPWTGKPLRPVQ